MQRTGQAQPKGFVPPAFSTTHETLDRHRVAVLPLQNISPDPNDEYFADGLTEELINAMSHVHGLRVIARTSVTRYKETTKPILEIGRELGVGSIVEGSVRKIADRIRVTAQLIDVSTEEHIWSSNYDRKMEDIFAIQGEVAESVAQALRVALVEGEKKSIERIPTKSPIAYAKYLKARVVLRHAGVMPGVREQSTIAALKEGKRLLEEAIAEDAAYAEAYAVLGDVYHRLGIVSLIPMPEAGRRRGELLSKALSLNGDSAEVHTSLGDDLIDSYRYAEAENHFETAISLNPNYHTAHHRYALLLADMGRFEEALKELELAEEADPLSLVTASNLTTIYSVLGRKDEAAQALRKFGELGASDYEIEDETGFGSFIEGDFERSYEHYERAVLLRGKEVQSDPLSMCMMALACARTNRREKAIEILEALRSLPVDRYGRPAWLGMTYLGLGELDRGFEHLESAFREHSLWFRMLRIPFPTEVRNDRRFIQLFTRVSLIPPRPA